MNNTNETPTLISGLKTHEEASLWGRAAAQWQSMGFACGRFQVQSLASRSKGSWVANYVEDCKQIPASGQCLAGRLPGKLMCMVVSFIME